jgi:hypothetical protein
MTITVLSSVIPYPSKPHGLVATNETFNTSIRSTYDLAQFQVSLASRHFHTIGVARKVVVGALPKALSLPRRRESLRKGKWPL